MMIVFHLPYSVQWPYIMLAIYYVFDFLQKFWFFLGIYYVSKVGNPLVLCRNSVHPMSFLCVYSDKFSFQMFRNRNKVKRGKTQFLGRRRRKFLGFWVCFLLKSLFSGHILCFRKFQKFWLISGHILRNIWSLDTVPGRSGTFQRRNRPPLDRQPPSEKTSAILFVCGLVSSLLALDFHLNKARLEPEVMPDRFIFW